MRQRTLAGDVARAGRCLAVRGWFLAVAGRLCRLPGGSMLRTKAGGSCGGGGLVIRWPARSGGLRGGDGDDAAGVELLELPHQVVLPGIGGFAAGVEVGAQVGIRLAGLQDAVWSAPASLEALMSANCSPVYQTPVLYCRFPRTFSAAYQRYKNGYAPRYTTAPSLPWRPSHHQPLANRHGDR